MAKRKWHEWFWEWFRLRTLLLILVVGLTAFISYRYWWNHAERTAQEEEAAEQAQMLVPEEEPHPPQGLDEFRAQLRADRVDFDVAVPAIYILFLIIPLAAFIYLIASLMQSLASLPQKLRGDSKADLAKARSIRAKREAEAQSDDWGY